jgi:hypothetical protein
MYLIYIPSQSLMESVGRSTAVHDEVNGLILVEWHSHGYGHTHSCAVHDEVNGLILVKGHSHGYGHTHSCAA